MLYRCAKKLARFAVSQFFSRISKSGAEPAEEGPLIVVCNHQNSIVDPLVVQYFYRRDLWFIAKSTYFRGQLVGRLLKALHMVPVKRRQDFPAEEPDNSEMFRFSSSALSAGRALLIFPEGMSLGVRKLQPIKTGAARIALQAEAEFSLNLKIQAVGLTYTDIQHFRSSVHAVFGEPIAVSTLYERSAVSGGDFVKDLTSEIENQLRGLTVNVEEVQQNRLVERIGKLYLSAGRAPADLAHPSWLAQFAGLPSAGRESIERRLAAYEEAAMLWNIDIDRPLEQKMNPLLVRALTPAVVFGYLMHYVPYHLVGPLGRAIIDHPAASASMKILLSLVLYPLWYLLLFAGFAALGCSLKIGLLLILAIFISGMVANNYYDGVHLYLVNGLGRPLDALRTVRDELLQELEILRMEQERARQSVT